VDKRVKDGCKHCGEPLPVTARADAEYCDELCRSRYKNERRKQEASTTRVNAPSGGVGSRGGNVRSIEEARLLQSESQEKDRWRLIVQEQIIRTLLSTGYFHADDLEPLGVPAAHCNTRGAQVGSFRSRGLMEKTGEERKVAHAAANARKGQIFRISAKGRRELPKMLIDVRRKLAGLGTDEASEEVAGLDSAELPVSPAPISAQSGESGVGAGSGEGVPTPRGPGGANIGVPCCASTASPDSSTGDQGQARGAKGEPVDAVPGAAQLFDLDDARPAPPSNHSAFTNPEAA